MNLTILLQKDLTISLQFLYVLNDNLVHICTLLVPKSDLHAKLVNLTPKVLFQDKIVSSFQSEAPLRKERRSVQSGWSIEIECSLHDNQVGQTLQRAKMAKIMTISGDNRSRQTKYDCFSNYELILPSLFLLFPFLSLFVFSICKSHFFCSRNMSMCYKF